MKRQLYFRLTAQGETVSDYTSGRRVRPDRWNQKEQRVTGWDKIAIDTNQHVGATAEQHRAILVEMTLLYFKGVVVLPTAALVKAEFTKPGTTQPQSRAGNNPLPRSVGS